MGFWPNLAQLLSTEKTLTRLKADSRPACSGLAAFCQASQHPLPEVLPGQAQEMLGEEALPFLLRLHSSSFVSPVVTTGVLRKKGGEGWQEEGEAMGPPMKMQGLGEARRCRQGIVMAEGNNLNDLEGEGKEKEGVPGNLKNQMEEKEAGERPRMDSELARDTE